MFWLYHYTEKSIFEYKNKSFLLCYKHINKKKKKNEKDYLIATNLVFIESLFSTKKEEILSLFINSRNKNIIMIIIESRPKNRRRIYWRWRMSSWCKYTEDDENLQKKKRIRKLYLREKSLSKIYIDEICIIFVSLWQWCKYILFLSLSCFLHKIYL